ncbi:MAG: SpoIIIAH-like family protein [Oscillospiraceae bacterium]
MKLWKRNAVVAAIVLFVCVAVYLNWSYSKNSDGDDLASGGKLLGEATLVDKRTDDPLLSGTTDVAAPKADTYFASARLNRQTARDSALALLQEAAANEQAEQTVKDEANVSIQTMAKYTMSEAQIENLVTAKGYADCVAFIGENSVSVVVSAPEAGLAAEDTAKITEIAMEETGLTAEQIKIIKAE